MTKDILADELENYRIGPKVRALRASKSLGLTQLGEHTGISAGMLSKIERGQITPTLPTLMKISLVFGVGLEHFFKEPEEPALEIIRAKNRMKFPNTREKMPSYFFESLDFAVNDRPFDAYSAEFLPRKPASDPHEHAGVELVYVLAGEVVISIHEQTHVLGTGDCLYFASEFPHSYQCGEQGKAKAVIVSAASVE